MAKTPPQPVPPPDDLLDMAEAATKNARGLLSDADLLLKNERWPRAFALSVLALEETGKAHLCVVALSGEVEPAAFWKELQLHPPKLAIAAGPETLLGDAAPTLDQVSFATGDGARARHQRKMQGLYVDYVDGVIRTPDDVTKAEAVAMLDLVERMVQFLEGVSQAFGLDEVRQLVRDPEALRSVWKTLLPPFIGPDLETTFQKMGVGMKRAQELITQGVMTPPDEVVIES